MPWDTLSKDQQDFISTCFPAKRGLFKKARTRKSKTNAAIVAQYEDYLAKKALLTAELGKVSKLAAHADLSAKLDKIKTDAESTFDFDKGMQQLDALRNEIKSEAEKARRAASAHPEKLTEFEKHNTTMFAARDVDEKLIGRLKKALLEQAGPEDEDPIDPDNLPQIKALKSVQSDGMRKLKALFDGDLEGDPYKSAMTAAMAETAAARETARNEIEATITSPTSIAKATEVLSDDRSYRELLGTCSELLQELQFWGHPKAPSLTSELNGVRKDTASTGLFEVGVSALTLWKKSADKERTDYLAAFEKALAPHQENLAKVKAIKARLAKTLPESQVEEFDMLIAMAEQTIATATDASKGKNIAALTPLQGVLTSASVLGNELLNAETLNAIIANKITGIEAILGTAASVGAPEGKSVLPNKFDAKRTEFVEIHKDWQAMSPQKAQMVFTQMLMDAETFKTEVDTMKAWRARMDDAAKEVEKLNKQLSKIVFDFGKEEHGRFATKMREMFGRTGIEFEGTAATDLADIKQNILNEDPTTQSFTEKKLQDLTGRLANWIGAAEKLRAAQKAGEEPTAGDMNMVAALLDDQQKAVDAREAKEAAIAAFKSKSEAVADMIKRLSSDSTVTDETKQEYDDIADLNKKAISQAKGDLDAAEEMHSRVKYRMARAMGAPPKAKDNFAWLAGMPKFWADATANMVTGFENLRIKVKAEAKDEPSIDEENLDDDMIHMATVANSFDPKAFDACAKVLGDPATASDMDARKRAREQALQQVRLYRAYLTSNMVIRHAVKNPFKIDGIATAVHLSLNKIELEVLRGI